MIITITKQKKNLDILWAIKCEESKLKRERIFHCVVLILILTWLLNLTSWIKFYKMVFK